MIEFTHNFCFNVSRHVLGPFELVIDRLQISAELYILLDFILDCVNDQLIWWLLFKLQCEYLLKHLSEVFWDYSEHFFSVFDLQPLFKEVSELVACILILLVEVTPWQVVLVQEIDHDIHDTLNVIPP